MNEALKREIAVFNILLGTSTFARELAMFWDQPPCIIIGVSCSISHEPYVACNIQY